MDEVPAFPEEEYQARLDKVRAEMVALDLDGLVVATPENIFYLTGLDHQGFFALHLLIVPRAGQMILIARAMERITVQDQVTGARFVGYGDSQDPARVTAVALTDASLAGGRLGIEPRARVDHDYVFDKGPAKYRMLERNRLATVVRTFPGPLLWLVLPGILATELALIPISLAGGYARQKLLADVDVLRWLPRLLRERRAVQARRALSPREFAEFLTPDLDNPYLGRAARLPLLRGLLRGYWALVLRLLRLAPGAAAR